jgi:hypothetical protein
MNDMVTSGEAQAVAGTPEDETLDRLDAASNKNLNLPTPRHLPAMRRNTQSRKREMQERLLKPTWIKLGWKSSLACSIPAPNQDDCMDEAIAASSDRVRAPWLSKK